MARLAALTLAALLALAGTAGARAWTTPRLLAPGGYDPAAAIGVASGAGVVYASRGGSRYAVTLRRGTVDRGLTRAVTVLRSTHALDSPKLAFVSGSGTAAVAWRQLQGSRRLRLRRIPQRGQPDRVVRLTGAGESAFDPFFVPGPLNLVAWSRRTSAAAAMYDRYAYTVDLPRPLPAGATSQIALAESAGTILAVWPQHGRVFAAAESFDATSFGPATPISPADGFARSPKIAADLLGNPVVVWTSSHGSGNAVLAAARLPGGAFTAPTEIAPATEGATSLNATLTADGAVLVTYVATGRSFPVTHFSGPVRLARLDAAPVTLTRAGERATAVVASAGEVAWVRSGGAAHPIHTRAIGPGGVLGPVQTVPGAGATTPVQLTLAANASGRAILAYVAKGVRVTLLR